MDVNSQKVQPIPPFSETNEETPEIGGGLPVIEYWAEHTHCPRKDRNFGKLCCTKVLVCPVLGALAGRKEVLRMKRAKNFSGA